MARYELYLQTSDANTSISGVAEGGTITIQLRTRDVANGTTVAYTISGSGIAENDFSPATLIGSFIVSSTDGGVTGTATQTLTIASDAATEGQQVAVMALNNGQASIGFIIGDSSQTALTNIEGIKIRTVDYNNIRTKAISLLGTGLVDSGYGQSTRSSEVTVSSIVTVNEWANLRNDINTIWKHQFGTLSPIDAPLANNLVRANATSQPYQQYDNFANILTANRFGIDVSQAITRNKASTSTTWPGTYGSTWNNTIGCTVTVSWATAEAARYFFNSGSEIRFNSSRTGGGSFSQNNSWTTILNSIGTRAFGANKPGQGTSPSTGQNWYRLTSSFQIWESTSASSPYGLNSYQISARTPSVANNSSGTASSIEFQVRWIDDHVPILDSPEDFVNGTMSLAVTTLEASGILEPSGLGLTFSVETPTVAITTIQPV